MSIDDIAALQEQHSAWKLLRAANAPLILSFLGQRFVDNNEGAAPASRLIDALDEHLYVIHQHEPEKYGSEPQTYLDDWAAPKREWLRKFYPIDSDEVHFDATPAVAKACRWVQDLQACSFVGTESRLHTLIELLRQIVHGSETDPETRIATGQRPRSAHGRPCATCQNSCAVFLKTSRVTR